MRFVAIVLFCLLAAGPILPATFTVNSTNDAVDASPGNGLCETVAGNGVCTLRAAVQEAGALPGQNTIIVPAGTYVLSKTPACNYYLTGNSNLLSESLSALCVRGNVILQGAGPESTIIDAGGAGGATCCGSYPSSRGMLVSGDATLNLSGVTIQNGLSNGGYVAIGGGGIINSGHLKVSNTLLTANRGIPGGGGIWNNGTLLLDGVTMSANLAGVYGGAGLYNNTNATADVVNSTFSNGNSGAQGGAVLNYGGTVRISSSTMNNNLAAAGGGGAHNDYGSMSLTNVTISGNQAFIDGAISTGQLSVLTANNITATLNTAIYHTGGIGASGTFTLRNSIVAGNSEPGPIASDCEGSPVSQGHNLITAVSSLCHIAGPATGDLYGVQPQLGVLTSNGGSTRTHGLLAGSPAIDAGDPASPGSGANACAVLDQRGYFRPQGARCDIGAFESSSVLAVSAISPVHAGNTGIVETVVSGSALMNGAVVRLSRAGQPDIAGTQVAVQPGSAALGALFDLTGRAPGAWDLVVNNPDASCVTLPGAFTVDNGGTPQVWAQVVGPARARPGDVNFYLVFGNRGNADALGVPVALSTQTQTPLTISFPITPPPAQNGQVSTDWTTVPVYTSPAPTNGFINVPFFIPVIPAGYSGALRFRVTLPPSFGEGSRFTLSAATSSPFLNPGLDSALLNTIVTGAIQYAQTNLGAAGTSPSVNAVSQYVTNQMQLTVANGRAALAASTNAAPQVYSLGQMSIDTAQYVAASVGRLATPHLRASVVKHTLAGANPGGGGSSCSGAVMTGGESCTTGNDSKIPAPDDPRKPRPFTPADCRSLGNHYVSADGSMCLPNPGQGCPIIQNPFLTDPNCTRVPIVTSVDPNAKYGPSGYGPQQFTNSAKAFGYTVEFENLATAPVPAQQVLVTDQLDTTNLDLSTFSLGPISFGSFTLTPPPGTQQYHGGLDLRPDQNIVAVVDARLNPATGVVTWQFSSIDPATQQLTSSAEAGFLPPNVTPPQGEGRLLYTIRPKVTLVSGTTVCNQASVVFDTNAPIRTGQWCNTTDDIAPSSRVQSLPATQTSTSIPVQWSGSDAGSGVHDYTIYVADNGGAYAAWLSNTNLTQSSYTGVSGHTYAFYSIARDNVGNREPAKTAAEATTTVGGTSTCATDITGQFAITQSGYRFNNATQRFVQTVTITRSAASALNGPFALAVRGLSANAALYNPAGTTNCIAPGSAYILVDPGTQWNAGQTLTVTLEFTNPTRAGITYTPILLAGSTR